MDYDDILEKINGFGKWQKRIIILLLPIFLLQGIETYM